MLLPTPFLCATCSSPGISPLWGEHSVTSHLYCPRLQCAVSLGLTYVLLASRTTDIQVGLQLCEAGASSSYGVAQCGSRVGGCQGSTSNYCYPYHMWSGSLLDTESYRVLDLASGSFSSSYVCGGAGKCSSPHAFSVRCVLGFEVCVQLTAL